MMNTIYLVRHGENPANILREFSYRTVDYSLTPRGVEQARQAAAFFRAQPIDAIYSSPLKRARETAAEIAAALDLPITVLEELREINIGDLEGQSTDENWVLHDAIVADWERGNVERTFPGGENFTMLAARAAASLRAMIAGRSGQRIAVVAHGGIMRAIARGLCPPIAGPAAVSPACPNCSITEIVAGMQDGALVAELRAWALCEHLAEYDA
ncbi:MAG: histidine phosphatase family protein [Thermomicrobiales bacterium]